MTPDATDSAMRDGMRELAKSGDPMVHPYLRDVREHYRLPHNGCLHCYSTTDNNLVLHPQFCERHRIEAQAARVAFGYVKYERCFDREGDANARALVIRHLYGTRDDLAIEVVPVAHLWLVLARWGFTIPGGWGKP